MSSPHVRIVRIVQLDAPSLQALAEGDLARAQASASVPLTPWLVSPECTSTWRMRARQAVETPEDLDWVTGVLWDEDVEIAVGRAGYHGAPDANGMVEVGYAVDPALRRRGYARAALVRLLERARSEPGVRTLRATVSPTNVASLALVAQYPFVEVGEQWDEEDGLETIFEIPLA